MLPQIIALAGLILCLLSAVWVANTLRVTETASGFMQAGNTTTVSDELSMLAAPTVGAAKTGTLTTRTSGTVGTLTMSSGHGITTGSRIDIFWDGGSCHSCTVGTVATNSVPFTTAVGDALPAATTAVKVSKVDTVAFVAEGDDMTALVASSQQEGWVIFATDVADVYAFNASAGVSLLWYTGGLGVNPLAGESITKIYFSHNLTTAEVTTMQAGCLIH